MHITFHIYTLYSNVIDFFFLLQMYGSTLHDSCELMRKHLHNDMLSMSTIALLYMLNVVTPHPYKKMERCQNNIFVNLIWLDHQTVDFYKIQILNTVQVSVLVNDKLFFMLEEIFLLTKILNVYSNTCTCIIII